MPRRCEGRVPDLLEERDETDVERAEMQVVRGRSRCPAAEPLRWEAARQW